MAVPDAPPAMPVSGELPTAAAQALLAASPDALLQLDATGRIAWSNGRLEALCGLPAGALAGRDVRELLDRKSVV